ncbi:hypothetical protein FHR84_003187 [Actinopolyspora biskrensis]|uniref:Uncharacterized protein n=1 Tax=Actinopolyspora biskrensis TaxID=1470178 RepID=A0A852Z262_9ACTN|nr:hypothetical protein [Actinopolyspora biskrensis]NYH79849.1 hypothetical protein [Actinopolyspora biskrensis]
MPSHLNVSVVLPEDSTWNEVETKFLIDGRDVIDPEFDTGPCLDPDMLLGSDSPLLPAKQPREVMLAEAECAWGCCGAVYVRVRRDGDQVVRDRWHNPDDDDFSLAEVRFDSEQYEAELARAHAERSWEWPGRTVARLLRTRLRAEPTALGQWNSSLGRTGSSIRTPNRVEMMFTSPSRDVVRDHLRTHGDFPRNTPSSACGFP